MCRMTGLGLAMLALGCTKQGPSAQPQDDGPQASSGEGAGADAGGGGSDGGTGSGSGTGTGSGGTGQGTGGATGGGGGSVELGPCPTPGPIQQWGQLESDQIREASGLAHSTQAGGILWTHNDAGNPPELFALSEQGQLAGVWSVDTTMRDWEDLSLAWDDSRQGNVLFVADMGDNGRNRSEYTVLLIDEPTVSTEADDQPPALIAPFATLTLSYPESAARDSESLAVDPVTGDIVVVVKSTTGKSDVYVKAPPHVDGEQAELRWVAMLEMGTAPLDGSVRTTAADFSPSGEWFAIRTYSHAWLWRRPEQIPLEVMLEGEPCDLFAPVETQGEAFAFRSDESGYITVSEGVRQPIFSKDLAP